MPAKGWKKPAGTMSPRQMRMPTALWERIEAVAKRQGVSVSEYLRRAAEEKLKVDELELRLARLEDNPHD